MSGRKDDQVRQCKPTVPPGLSSRNPGATSRTSDETPRQGLHLNVSHAIGGPALDVITAARAAYTSA